METDALGSAPPDPSDTRPCSAAVVWAAAEDAIRIDRIDKISEQRSGILGRLKRDGRSMLRPAMQINTSERLVDVAGNFSGALLIEEHDSRAAQHREPSTSEDRQKQPAGGPTVLLVDDNVAVLSSAMAALLGRCDVLGTARGGEAALEAAAALEPDIIVLDISMPGMSGFDLARRLRAAGSTAQLVFLTVHEEDEFILAARAAGAIGYVVKSRLSADLEVAVRDAAAGRPFQSPLDP